MPLAIKLMLGITAASFLAGLGAFIFRRPALGVTLVGASVAATGLFFWAATRYDPPSLLPLWMWLLGLFLGALVGYELWRWTRRSKS